MKKLTLASYFSKKSDTQFLNNNVPCIFFFFERKIWSGENGGIYLFKAVIETLEHQNV